ncbi:mitochondrial carrier domain-containing protein [Gilbertella persicaria]|uniref:mitochondrial carrier domain-containing protein n=1 Tax=Gilbertella persicaria TaxID=101096 RepID=UPI00222028DC|nr:mitochondrial carrier domain-containing protein [Gilbertella persicaria]KAI8095078.1 mitochondrial carrier domain-containing protein [Gilbertella persicaria]
MPSYVTDANLSSRELAFCGGVAGIVSRAVIAPLDVIKIRMQLQTHRTRFGFGHTVENVKYPNMRQAFVTIMKEEGIRGLYKGNMPAEYLYLSYSAVEFWAYKELEQAIELFDKRRRLPHALNTFGCGMIAGCAATAATYPFDLLRTRFASQGGPQKYSTSVTRAMADIYKTEGVFGFYRGLWPAIIQIMPYMGLLFSTYDVFAKGFKKLRDENILSSSYKPTHDMISGALSGFVSKIVVYPFDLVRKRLQMDTRNINTSSWWTCLKSIIRQEGFASLYKGLGPSLVKVAPANAVTFMVFEETKDVLLWFKK